MSQMRPNTSVYGMYIPHQAHKKKKKKRRNKMMGTPPLPQNKMIWGALRIGSVLNNACSLYFWGIKDKKHAPPITASQVKKFEATIWGCMSIV